MNEEPPLFARLRAAYSIIVLAAVGFTLWRSSGNIAAMFYNISALVPMTFVGLVSVVFWRGVGYAQALIKRYDKEQSGFGDQRLEDELISLAGKTQGVLKEGLPLAVLYTELALPAFPLLERKLRHLVRSLHTGSPLLASEHALAEEHHFPEAERRLRAYMDIVLNLGIAGTFSALVVSFATGATGSQTGGPGGADPVGALLAHVGPGLLSGLVAILANVGLRLCHGALLDSQDILATRADDLLTSAFIARLEPSLLDPYVRLRVGLEGAGGRWLAALQTDFRTGLAAIRTDLREVANTSDARLIAALEKRDAQVIATLGRIDAQITAQAENSGRIAASSEQWGKVAEELEVSLTGYARVHRESLVEFQETLDADRKQAEERLVARLAAQHEAHLEVLGNAGAAQLARSLELVGEAVDTRLTAITRETEALLTHLRTELPAVVGGSVTPAVDRLSSAAEAIRVGAEEVGQKTAETAASADLLIAALTEWDARARQAYTDISDLLRRGQEAQTEALSTLHQHNAEILDALRTELVQASGAARDAGTSLRDTVARMQASLDNLGAPLDTVADRLQSLDSPLGTLREDLDSLPGRLDAVRAQQVDDWKGQVEQLRDLLATLGKDNLEAVDKALVARLEAVDTKLGTTIETLHTALPAAVATSMRPALQEAAALVESVGAAAAQLGLQIEQSGQNARRVTGAVEAWSKRIEAQLTAQREALAAEREANASEWKARKAALDEEQAAQARWREEAAGTLAELDRQLSGSAGEVRTSLTTLLEAMAEAVKSLKAVEVKWKELSEPLSQSAEPLQTLNESLKATQEPLTTLNESLSTMNGHLVRSGELLASASAASAQSPDGTRGPAGPTHSVG